VICVRAFFVLTLHERVEFVLIVKL